MKYPITLDKIEIELLMSSLGTMQSGRGNGKTPLLKRLRDIKQAVNSGDHALAVRLSIAERVEETELGKAMSSEQRS